MARLLVKQQAQALGLHDGKIQANEYGTENNERNNKRNKVVVQISPLPPFVFRNRRLSRLPMTVMR
jgi:hypothetical protein